MFTPNQYRTKAAEYAELIKGTDIPNKARELRKRERSFTTLADNEEWLAQNYNQTMHALDDVGDGETSLLAKEERILRYLGAAVIMQWNNIPTKLRRELFNNASSMGELLQTAELKGQIARFLHKHKDDDQ